MAGNNNSRIEEVVDPILRSIEYVLGEAVTHEVREESEGVYELTLRYVSAGSSRAKFTVDLRSEERALYHLGFVEGRWDYYKDALDQLTEGWSRVSREGES